MCPSSEEFNVSMRHLVFVTLCGWLSGMQGGMEPCIPDSHPHRVTNTKCRTDTVISPDDGHIVARNMCTKEINTLKKLWTKLSLFSRLYKDARQQNSSWCFFTILTKLQILYSINSNFPISNFTHIRSVGAELIYWDKQRSMTKLIGSLCDIMKERK